MLRQLLIIDGQWCSSQDQVKSVTESAEMAEAEVTIAKATIG